MFLMYRGIPIRQTMNFSVETLHARIEWGEPQNIMLREIGQKELRYVSLICGI